MCVSNYHIVHHKLTQPACQLCLSKAEEGKTWGGGWEGREKRGVPGEFPFPPGSICDPDKSSVDRSKMSSDILLIPCLGTAFFLGLLPSVPEV